MNLNKLNTLADVGLEEGVALLKGLDGNIREKYIDRIESYFGDLQSIPYDKVSSQDLRKMYNRLLEDGLIKP